jgi:hypothetical protein
MSSPTTHPSRSKLRQAVRAIGEVFAFFGAGAYAILQLCLGRWPEPSRPDRRKPQEKGGVDVTDDVGPFPMHD